MMIRSTIVRDLLDEALGRDGPQRDAFLDEACGDNHSLRAELAELVIAFQKASSFLEPPEAPEAAAASPDQSLRSPLVGRQIGRYTIVREIATGGMGAVYEALQDQPRRSVAIKVMRHGIASRSALRRFEYESQILARLRHQCIAQVYEAGMHDDGSGGVPFFAMEFIPNALTLIEFAQSRHLSVHERLTLFIKVCEAVHFGHQKGIIHRDLKPGNILVDSTTGGGEPKIIDFGVARATDADLAATTVQTGVGQLIGTLQYMSPEQCDADPHEIDVRTDVYSLGIVLYELLTGRPPHDLSRLAIFDALHVIRHENPARLSVINPALRGDLETIVSKAIEKDRNRRYRSAAELSDDVRRFLDHEPISARPASFAYQFRMFAKRNRALVRSLAAIWLLLTAAVITVSFLWARAERARHQKNDLADRMVLLYGAQFQASVNYADRAKQRKLALQIIASADSELKTRNLAEYPDVDARLRMGLAEAYRVISEYPSSAEQVDRAIQIATTSFGPHAALTVEAIQLRAVLYRDTADLARAEELFRQVIDIQRRHWPKRDWNTQAWHNLSDMLHDIGRCDEAEPLAAEALDIVRQNSPVSADFFMWQLAGIWRDQGRFDQAAQLYAQARDDAARIRPGHETVWKACRELARIDLFRGDIDGAMMQSRKAQECCTATGADAYHNNIDALLCEELASLIDMSRHHFEAAQASLDSIATRTEQSFASEPAWWAAHFRTQQAICLIKLKRYQEAGTLLDTAYPTLQQRLGDAHHRTQNCIRALVELHEATGDAEATATWRHKLRDQGCSRYSLGP